MGFCKINMLPLGAPSKAVMWWPPYKLSAVSKFLYFLKDRFQTCIPLPATKSLFNFSTFWLSVE